MALRFVDGFDYYGNFGNEYFGNYVAHSGDTSLTTGRTGSGKALRYSRTVGDGSNIIVARTIPVTIVGNTIILQLGLRFGTPANAWIVRVTNSSESELFRISRTSAGFFQVLHGSTTVMTSTDTFAIGQWIHLSVKVVMDNVAGEVRVQMNGVDAGSQTDVKTIANELTSTVFVSLCGPQGINGSNWNEFDDIVIMDGSGAHFNDFIGDRTVITLPVVSDAAPNQWTPSAGTDHYALVDEIGPNSADYLTADTTGQQELFSVANLPAGYAGASGIAICVKARAFKSDAGSRLLKLLYQPSGGSITASAPQALGTTAQYVSTIVETNPLTGLPFTQAEIDALSIGVEAA